MEEEMIGAIKIKDGLFIGDESSAQVIYALLIFRILNSFLPTKWPI